MQEVNEKLLNIIDRLQLTIDLMKDVSHSISPISDLTMRIIIRGCEQYLDWIKRMEEVNEDPR